VGGEEEEVGEVAFAGGEGGHAAGHGPLAWGRFGDWRLEIRDSGVGAGAGLEELGACRGRRGLEWVLGGGNTVGCWFAWGRVKGDVRQEFRGMGQLVNWWGGGALANW
jgi:hypothetical protein